LSAQVCFGTIIEYMCSKTPTISAIHVVSIYILFSFFQETASIWLQAIAFLLVKGQKPIAQTALGSPVSVRV
jgi:hypothetical protein